MKTGVKQRKILLAEPQKTDKSHTMIKPTTIYTYFLLQHNLPLVFSVTDMVLVNSVSAVCCGLLHQAPYTLVVLALQSMYTI